MDAENREASWDHVPRGAVSTHSIASTQILKARIQKRRESMLQKIKIDEQDPSGRGRYVVRQSALKEIFFPHYAPKEYLTAKEKDEAAASGMPYKRSTRARIVDFLQGKNVQLALIILLMLDVVFVIAEIIVLTHKEPVLELSHRCEDLGLHLSFNDTEDLYYVPDSCGFSVENELSSTLHDVELSLLWASRAILFIFAAELITLTVCLGRAFFTPMYTLDSVVIYLSIILSFVMEDEQEEVAVIIFLRCWRFARILHGFGLTIHDVDKEAAEEELEEAVEEVDKRMTLMEVEMDELRKTLREAKDELHALRKEKETEEENTPADTNGHNTAPQNGAPNEPFTDSNNGGVDIP